MGPVPNQPDPARLPMCVRSGCGVCLRVGVAFLTCCVSSDWLELKLVLLAVTVLA